MKSKFNALSIDDDPISLKVTNAFCTHYASEFNYQKVNIKTFSDPVQGFLEISVHGEKYDIILLDVKMKRLRGDEIFSCVNRNQPQLINKIIFYTSSPEFLLTKLPGHLLQIMHKPGHYSELKNLISTSLKMQARRQDKLYRTLKSRSQALQAR